MLDEMIKAVIIKKCQLNLLIYLLCGLCSWRVFFQPEMSRIQRKHETSFDKILGYDDEFWHSPVYIDFLPDVSPTYCMKEITIPLSLQFY